MGGRGCAAWYLRARLMPCSRGTMNTFSFRCGFKAMGGWTVLLLAVLPIHWAEGAAVGSQKLATVTAYCACPRCCGDWAEVANARRDMLVSGTSIAGPRKYPLGTHVWIEGLGERIITDRPARRYDSRFDLYFTNHQEAATFGKKTLKVKLLATPKQCAIRKVAGGAENLKGPARPNSPALSEWCQQPGLSGPRKRG